MRAVAERTSVDQWSVPLWAAAEDGGRNCDRFDVSDLRVAAVDTPIHTYATPTTPSRARGGACDVACGNKWQKGEASGGRSL